MNTKTVIKVNCEFLIKSYNPRSIGRIARGAKRSKNVARFFPLLFEVHSCQVRLFAIPRRALPSLVLASRVWVLSLLAGVFLELGRRA